MVSGQTAFARWRHDFFRMEEKKRNNMGAGSESRRTGLREIQKVEKREQVSKG